MSLKPTKYAYTPAAHIAGQPNNFTITLEITQNPSNSSWAATLKITSADFSTSGEAQKRLRDELTRLAEQLGTAL